jgi:hypothetical protein
MDRERERERWHASSTGEPNVSSSWRKTGAASADEQERMNRRKPCVPMRMKNLESQITYLSIHYVRVVWWKSSLFPGIYRS